MDDGGTVVSLNNVVSEAEEEVVVVVLNSGGNRVSVYNVVCDHGRAGDVVPLYNVVHHVVHRNGCGSQGMECG